MSSRPTEGRGKTDAEAAARARARLRGPLHQRDHYPHDPAPSADLLIPLICCLDKPPNLQEVFSRNK